MKMNKKTKGFFQWLLFFIIGLSTQLFLFSYEKEIKTISQELAKKIEEAGKKSIAVVDFNDLQGNITELGRFLAEEFSTALVSSGKGFEVVDRTHLKSILAEHKLSTTGLIDPQTARKLGQIVGVEAIITGTITPFGDSVRLSVKVLVTDTAKVITASTGNIPKTKAIEELLSREVEQTAITISGQTKKSISKKIAKEEIENFIFEAKSCKMSGQKMICEILVTNTEEKEYLIAIRGTDSCHTSCECSYLYDYYGNQYKPIDIQFGAIIDTCSVRQSIPPSLPVVVKLKYDNVLPDVKSVSIRISVYIYDGSRCVYPLLRNIPVNK
jgi:TolB-like protein